MVMDASRQVEISDDVISTVAHNIIGCGAIKALIVRSATRDVAEGASKIRTHMKMKIKRQRYIIAATVSFMQFFVFMHYTEVLTISTNKEGQKRNKSTSPSKLD